LASLHNITKDDIQARFDEGAHCYVSFVADGPAGYGWVGIKVGHLRDVGMVWLLGEGDRYLWDFVTLPAFRGRGVYPHLLQAILRAELAQAERFWIGHQGQNEASKRGIMKAGFTLHNLTSLTAEGQVVHEMQGDPTRALADPQRAVEAAFTQNIPEAVRQRMVAEFAHLFEQGG
ncbi:MAG: GNAT family N-acetyltransferase, partial [Anaerolineales bacterium]|nr:GNAT family N-acetyltransferase [Anaerolineales bacterium]